MFLGNLTSRTWFCLLHIWIGTNVCFYIMEKTRMKTMHNKKCKRVTLFYWPELPPSSFSKSLGDLQMLLSFKIPLKTTAWNNAIKLCHIVEFWKQIYVSLSSILVFPALSCCTFFHSYESWWKLVEQPLSQ